MKRIQIRLKNKGYSVLIGRGLLARVGGLCRPLGVGKKVLIVSNRRVARYYLRPVSKSLARAGFQVFSYLLPYGDERDKSGSVFLKLWRYMAQIPLERSSTVVALGGGVVGDLAGFAASTYMRGIALVQVPTTLLAQVDSAIGGKTAVDLPEAKNAVGTFYQPRLVISDVCVLKTLRERQFRSQFAEVIKYGVIADAGLFKLLEKKADSFFSAVRSGRFGPRELSFLETIVWRSAKVKAKVVEEDECETKGKRVVLNYGHTFAHAIEAASNFQISHGEAVAVGMVLAAGLAKKIGWINAGAERRQLELIRRSALPYRLGKSRASNRQLLSYMKRDKKVKNGRLRFVLPKRIGKVMLKEGISEKQILGLLNEFRRN